MYVVFLTSNFYIGVQGQTFKGGDKSGKLTTS